MFSANAIIGKDKTPVVYQAVPTQNAWTVSFSSVGRTNMSVSWTYSVNVNAPGLLVVGLLARSGSTNQSNWLTHFQNIHNVGPVNGKTYTDNSVFGSGDTVRGTVYGDKKFYVVKNILPGGTNPTNTVAVTNLISRYSYAYMLYTYTGSGVNTIYNLNTITSPGLNYGSRTTSA